MSDGLDGIGNGIVIGGGSGNGSGSGIGMRGSGGEWD